MTRVLRTEVVIVGAGAAGMYAAAEARAAGADVLLLDKSMVGRGGATIMAQMTVAAAVGHEVEDDWEAHYRDTITSGRGIANEPLAALMCHDGPARILEAWERGVNWAEKDGRLLQVHAPGHDRPRCCYVAGLQTGVGVVRGLKKELRRQGVVHLDTILVTEVITDGDGRAVGVAALDLKSGEPIEVWASAVVLACGGLTEMYARNSASVNMTGDAYALALRAGADLIDMEMVQFFPIANLAPRTIGLDPIMWDPFRYVLGGRLTNGLGDEFLERYAGVADEGTYRATRDVVTYGILREVEEGRGSPNGGAFLDFTDLPSEKVRDAFPAAYDRLMAQGIDLSQRAVEVAPTAHYTIGGVAVDLGMRTTVPGLYAVGEAVGGHHGANRLSGNALTEALVFGAVGGHVAAQDVRGAAPDVDSVARVRMDAALGQVAEVRGRNVESDVFLPALRTRLQRIMWDDVGPFRTAGGLERATAAIAELRDQYAAARVDAREVMNLEWQEWFELGMMLDVAEVIIAAASARTESRGAHQRDDFPAEDDAFLRNLRIRARDAGLELEWQESVALGVEPGAWTPPFATVGAVTGAGGRT